MIHCDPIIRKMWHHDPLWPSHKRDMTSWSIVAQSLLERHDIMIHCDSVMRHDIRVHCDPVMRETWHQGPLYYMTYPCHSRRPPRWQTCCSVAPSRRGGPGPGCQPWRAPGWDSLALSRWGHVWLCMQTRCQCWRWRWRWQRQRQPARLSYEVRPGQGTSTLGWCRGWGWRGCGTGHTAVTHSGHCSRHDGSWPTQTL